MFNIDPKYLELEAKRDFIIDGKQAFKAQVFPDIFARSLFKVQKLKFRIPVEHIELGGKESLTVDPKEASDLFVTLHVRKKAVFIPMLL